MIFELFIIVFFKNSGENHVSRNKYVYGNTLAPAFLADLVVAVHIPFGSIVPSVGLYSVPIKNRY